MMFFPEVLVLIQENGRDRVSDMVSISDEAFAFLVGRILGIVVYYGFRAFTK